MATEYTALDERGIEYPIEDAERVERLSRAGLRVTAVTGGSA